MGIQTEKKESIRSVSSSAFRFSMGTLLSRVTGMFREQITAYFFGTSPFIAAFLIATRFALLLRRLLGEGALLTGFIPRFEEKRVESEESAAKYFSEVHGALSWLLIFLLILLEVGLFLLLKANVFSSDNRQIVSMMMMILPSLFFICLYALCSALLQCKKKFFFPAVAPAIFNITWVLAVLWVLKSCSLYLILGLSLSTVVAYLVQWVILVPSAFRFFRAFYGFKQLFRFHFRSEELQRLLKSVSLTALGLGASQINGFLDILFSRFASLEGPAYLNYAMRLHQLPLALIGVAISSALLPSLSRAFKENDTLHFQELLRFGLKRVFTLIVPCTFGIFALGLCSVVLIYHRGSFHDGSVVHTTFCLWGFGLGLLPMTVALLLNQGFYARQEYRIPTLSALYSVVCNLLFNVLFIWILKLGPESVTISTSLAALINIAILRKRLFVFTGSLVPRETRQFVVKILLCSICAAIGTLVIGNTLGIDLSWQMALQKTVSFSSTLGGQCIEFFSSLALFAFFFFTTAYFLKLEEIFAFFRKKKPSEAVEL